MENTKSRSSAYIVAISNLTFEYLGFIIITVLTILWILYGEFLFSKILYKPDADEISALKAAVWAVLAVAFFFSVTRLWAGYLLWKGTQMEADFNVTIKYCRIWKIVTILFLVLELATCILTGFIEITIAALVIGPFCIKEVAFLYYVFCFTRELSSAHCEREIVLSAVA